MTAKSAPPSGAASHLKRIISAVSVNVNFFCYFFALQFIEKNAKNRPSLRPKSLGAIIQGLTFPPLPRNDGFPGFHHRRESPHRPRLPARNAQRPRQRRRRAPPRPPAKIPRPRSRHRLHLQPHRNLLPRPKPRAHRPMAPPRSHPPHPPCPPPPRSNPSASTRVKAPSFRNSINSAIATPSPISFASPPDWTPKSSAKTKSPGKLKPPQNSRANPAPPAPSSTA